ncbi:MAG: transketolase family protein [Mogibacterium sp.]|nr:transketolase family protein [Mogibacterium sp.]
MKIVYNGEKDSRQFKNIIGETVEALLKEDDKVVWLDADLMGCSGTNKIDDARVINCGIAEANMAGIAAGLSASGMKPYAHSFGPFASRRCFDQVFLAAGYANNPITMIGTDPGITAAFNGGTHMPFEDVALYRALPGATIFDITDVPMLVDALKKAKDMPGVKYIRVPRKDSYQVYADGTKFTPGEAVVLREGKDGVIVASGIMVHEALQAAEALAKDGIEMTVIDPITIKPLDVKTIREYAEKMGMVVVAENHNRIGGLTSAVQEAVCGLPLKFGYVAVEDEFGEVGPQDYLRKRFDLTCDHIAEVVKGLK